MGKSAAAAVLLVALLATSALGQESPSTVPDVTDQEKVVAYVQPSVVYLDIEYKAWVFDTFGQNDTYLGPDGSENDGTPFTVYSSCTGFFVDGAGTIATAGHCVDAAEADVVDAIYDSAAQWVYDTSYYQGEFSLSQIRGFAEEDYRIEGSNPAASGGGFKRGADVVVTAVWSTSSTEPLYDDQGNLNGEPHPARLVGFQRFDEGDVALLQVEVDNTPGLPVLDSEVATGAAVTSIGYPAAVMAVSDANLSDPSFKSGTISSVRTDSGINASPYPVYEMSTPMSPGMSGGPTVDADGEAIGVNSYGISAESQSFEFAQSSQTLIDFMGDEGIENDLGELGTAYRAGLDAYFAGDKTVAVRELQKAVGLDPGFDMAQEYLTLAQGLPDPPPPDEGMNPMLLVGLAAVLLLLGVPAYLLVRRGNRAEPEPAPVAVSPVEPATPPPAPPVQTESGTDVLGGFVKANEPTEKLEPPTQLGWICTRCGEHNADMEGRFCAHCAAPRAKDA